MKVKKKIIDFSFQVGFIIPAFRTGVGIWHQTKLVQFDVKKDRLRQNVCGDEQTELWWE